MLTRESYDKLRKDILDRCHGDLAALERVWKLGHPAPSANGNGHVKDPPRKGVVGRKPCVMAAVRELVRKLPEQFSTSEIVSAALEKADGHFSGKKQATLRTEVQQGLRQLERNGEIDEVEVGKGNRPSWWEAVKLEEQP